MFYFMNLTESHFHKGGYNIYKVQHVSQICCIAEAACPDNWEEFEGRCYLFVLNTDVSWSEANRYV